MGWRNLFIANPASLSSKDNGLLIKAEEKSLKIPLEDISTIILETNRVSLTGEVLKKLSENNIVMYSCDEKHLPCGVYHSYGRHSRQTAAVKFQINMSEALKKRMWQDIIKVKLRNQARVLSILGITGSDYLLILSKQVGSGDSKNLEAIGAKFYFEQLFGAYFNRRSVNVYNGALNYGYAIIRGAVARTLTAYGYILSLGIHHKNEYNNFNLADDFLEVYRPVVDLWVASNSEELTDELTQENKISLVNLLNLDVIFAGKKFAVNTSIEEMIKTLTKVVREGKGKLLLPEIISLEEHRHV